jgi:rhodanese-related sulfurtransferase
VTTRRVSATELLALQKVGYTLVDVRPPFDFTKGHPAGARNVPFYFYTNAGGIQDNPDWVTLMTSIFPKDTKLILIDKLGTRTQKAVELLLGAGFEEVCDLVGGYKGMESLGMHGTLTDEASFKVILAEMKDRLKKP